LNSDEATAFIRFASNAAAGVREEGLELATNVALALPLLALPPAVFKDWIKLIQVSEKVLYSDSIPVSRRERGRGR